MIKIAVCDDVIEICNTLENIIESYKETSKIEVAVDVFYNGEELIHYIQKGKKYDLIFLDIELGNINGVEVGRFLRTEIEDYVVKIVYISSKNEYDRQLFDVQPLHFLSKPLVREEVIQDIELALKIMEKETAFFSFKANQDVYRVPVKSILYFESMKRKIKLVTLEKIYYFYATIEAIETEVAKDRFIKPHRSYLVNYDKINQIKRDELVICNGDRVPISRLKVKEVKASQLKYGEERRY